MKTKIVTSLLVLLAISILPSCGKSKNQDDDVIGGVAIGATSFTGTTGGPGGCAQFAPTNGPISFPVAGQANIFINGFTANAPVGGSGYVQVIGANSYTRTNSSQDRIDLVLIGSPNSTGQVSATVTLSTMTVQALGGAYQPLCIQGVSFNNVGASVGSPALIYGNIFLYTSNGVIQL